MLRLLTLDAVALVLLGGLLLTAPRPGQARPDREDPAPSAKGPAYIDHGVHDPRLKGYRTPEGFKVEIVAEDPVVVNPIAMTFADDGTPYVIESRPSPGDERREAPETFKYRDGSTRTIPLAKKKVKDVVKTLTDSKGKGAYDKTTVVLEDELPSSLLLHDGWLYLSGGGTVRRYKPSKPGGPHDVKEVLLQGIGGGGQHQVAGLALGLDGWLYVSAGAADHFAEGSDGSRATVLRSGAVFRCKPDGSRLHTFAIGFSHPESGSFDVAGNLFLADRTAEGAGKYSGGRLMHVAEAADYGWRLSPGRGWQPEVRRSTAAGERPGKMPPLLVQRPGEPAGLVVYSDARLPEAYRGLLFAADLRGQVVRAHQIDSMGSTFKKIGDTEILSAPKDEAFRPCQVVIGPDGALYIVDRRTRSTEADKPWGEGHGRIYRLSWSGTKDEPALALRGLDSWGKIRKLPEKELLDTLSSEESTLRDQARFELMKRGEKNRKALLDLLVSDEKPDVARLAALGALQAMWDAEVQKGAFRVLEEGGAELRCLAAQELGLNAPKGDKETHNALLKALADDEPTVRRAVALAMGRVAGPGAADNLASTLSFDEGKDRYLRDGLVRALESLGAPGLKALVALGDSGVQKNTDLVVEAFLGLRSREAFEALPALLGNPHVSDAQKADLIRSAGNYLLDPPSSVDSILKYLVTHPDEPVAIRKAGLELLALPGVTVKGSEVRTWVLEQLASKDEALQAEAVVVLGATPEGARHAAREYLAGKLPRALQARVAEALRQHAGTDPESARLLAEVTKKRS